MDSPSSRVGAGPTGKGRGAVVAVVAVVVAVVAAVVAVVVAVVVVVVVVEVEGRVGGEKDPGGGGGGGRRTGRDSADDVARVGGMDVDAGADAGTGRRVVTARGGWRWRE